MYACACWLQRHAVDGRMARLVGRSRSSARRSIAVHVNVGDYVERD